MKKNIFTISILFSLTLNAQVIIGSGKSQPTNSSVSLEFGNEEKGLVLPYVTSASAVAGAVHGTMIFDSSDKKAKVMKNNGSWLDLSLQNNGVVDVSLQTQSELPNAKVSIGAPTTTPGILVLEDSNKAMILPKVTSYANISNPASGMMVFDTTKKLLCFFNGTQWSFWRP